MLSALLNGYTGPIPTPNYVNPPTRIWATPLIIIMWLLATGVLVLRIYLRARNLAGRYGLDDTVIIIAWMFGTALTGFSFSTIALDLGRHAWDVPLGNWVGIVFNTWISQPLFLSACGLTKVSILLFYRRLSEQAILKRWKWCLIGCIVFTVVWTIAFIIGQIFYCVPVQSYWLQWDLWWDEPHSCGSEKPALILVGILAILSDLYATALPVWLVRNLQMAKQTKVGLYVLFSLGLMVTAMSVARTVWITRGPPDLDISFYIYLSMFLLQTETQIGIFCACLPTLNVLLKRRGFTRIEKRTLTRESDERPMYSREVEMKSAEEVHEMELGRQMSEIGNRSFYHA